MEVVSTHSQDVQRGLAHPISIAARSQRIKLAHAHQAAINAKLDHAFCTIAANLTTGEQLAQLLHVASAAILISHGPTSYMREFVGKLDELADEVEA